VAALPLIDEHPFTSAREVYDRIVFGVGREPNLRMMVGQLLEPAVLDLGRRLLGLPLLACVRAYVHPSLPLTASPDAYCGPGALAEVKVTGQWSAGNIAPYVIWQVQAQLLLTGREVAHLVVLSGTNLQDIVIEADATARNRILEAVTQFDLEHLRPGHRPDVKPFVFGE
jgi:hypothetical protein